MPQLFAFFIPPPALSQCVPAVGRLPHVMSSCGLFGWACIAAATHNAGTCKLVSVECASNVGPGHDLFVRPVACSCRGKVCKGKCSMCLNEGHLSLTLKYAAAFQMVSVLRPS